MSEVRNYPNGYEITICKRRDILDCLDENIIDKQVVSSIIEELENELVDYVLNDKPANVPLLGCIKYIEESKIKESNEIKELFKEGREVLTKEEFVVFKSKLNKDIYSKVHNDRYYKFATYVFAKENPGFYKYLLQTHTELEAKIICYSLRVYTLEDQSRTYNGTN